MGSGVNCFAYGTEPSGSIKFGKISRLAKQLLARHETQPHGISFPNWLTSVVKMEAAGSSEMDVVCTHTIAHSV